MTTPSEVEAHAFVAVVCHAAGLSGRAYGESEMHHRRCEHAVDHIDPHTAVAMRLHSGAGIAVDKDSRSGCVDAYIFTVGDLHARIGGGAWNRGC